MAGDTAGPPVMVTLPEEIDLISHAYVRDVLFAALDKPGLVIADMTGTTFCDSPGARMLFIAHRHAIARGSALRVALLPGGAVARVLAIVGTDRMLHVYASVEDAIRAGPARAASRGIDD